MAAPMNKMLVVTEFVERTSSIGLYTDIRKSIFYMY